MTKVFFPLFFLVSFLSLAQFSNDAPWMPAANEAQRNAPLTLTEISARANTFFNQIDRDKKGSGYKPFKRSEYHWGFYLEPDGTLAKPDKLWAAWRQKMEMQQGQTARNIQVVSDWQPRGPYDYTNSGSWSTGQGRVNTVVVDPTDSNIYYMGAPAGGLWKSVDAGASWTPLTDDFPQIGISGIAIDANNHNIIYVTTGDDDAGDSYFVGVMKSTDGGLNWGMTGAISGNSANEIRIDPTDSDVIWVATDTGLYQSNNAGASWTNKLGGNIKDFRLKPGDSNTIYAVTINTFYKSTDAGNSFTTITSGLPSSSSRLVIDVTPANSNYVYVLSAKSDLSFQGLYKSIDSGENFTRTAEVNDIFNGSSQSWYDLALGVSDVDENTVFTGNLNIWKSTDGGDSFTEVNQWSNPSGAAYTHGDIHFLRYYNGVLFAGTDGRVSRSTDNGSSFTNLTEGIAIGQFYKIAVSKQSAGNMVGGLQDNGGFGYSTGKWYNFYGADGMDAAVDPNDQNTYYGFIQNGSSLYKSTQGGLNGQYVIGTPQAESGGAWVTPLVMSSTGVLHAGYSKLYKLVDNTWVRVSNTFFDFGGNLRNIEIDPSNVQNVYVSRGSTLFISDDSGLNFTSQSFSNTITSIEVHNSDSNILWLTTSSSVFKSTDKGANWTNITDNLPNESKNVIRHQKYHPNNPVYVGTNLGVYYRDDTMSNWEVFSTNLPNVQVTDLEVNENDAILTAATYGRGVWQSTIPVVLADDDVRLVSIVKPGQGISCGAVSPIIKINNNGLNPITSVAISYSVDGTNYNETWNGNLLSEEEVSVPLQTIDLDLGNHVMEVSVSIANDTYSDNNALSVSFNTTQSNDTPTLTNTFENVADTWLTDSNLWKRAEPNSTLLNTVASGTQAYITNPSGNYPDNTVSNLISPCYDLTTINNPVMSFQMAFDIEVDWDVLYMQYSIDNGETWQVLGTASDPNWYNNTYSDHALTIGGQWSGTATTLTEYTYDLAALTNESNIIFRFHFASDQSVNGEGALIDDFVILGETVGIDDYLAAQVKLYPNPTQGIFTIDWANDQPVTARVFDLTGKQLLKRQIPPLTQQQIDVSNYAKGFYLINFQTQRATFTKKILVE